mmetsp:Transcript_38786/g.77629  ORF Transcript_38786/g.77629 Transcript_38786/m.77629 type:complete len:121 (-) Transcript_38786:511-873(-)
MRISHGDILAFHTQLGVNIQLNQWMPSSTRRYWHSQEEYEQGHPSRGTVSIQGYEVLIDSVDPNFGFEVRPTVDGASKRTFCFRASSEDDRLSWARHLVLASMTSQRMPRRSNAHEQGGW